MNLLTEEIKKKLPKLYSQDSKEPNEIPIIVKFFCTYTQWTWYVIEGEFKDNDWLFFGYVCGFENELGYFTLSEITSTGSNVERDLYFGKHFLSEVMK